MTKQYKPDGYTSVSPYFVVKGAQKMVDFLTELFNAKVLRRYEHGDGTIVHIEVQLDDSVIMIGDASEEYPPNELLLHVYLPNVDDIYQKAIDMGCEALQPPKEQEGDPDRRGMFRDFAGNIWAVSTMKV